LDLFEKIEKAGEGMVENLKVRKNKEYALLCYAIVGCNWLQSWQKSA